MWLYDSNLGLAFPDRTRVLVYAVLWAGGLQIIGQRFSFGFYTTSILAQYVLLIGVSFYLYNIRKPVKEALCLSFLTVFLNSFYWELPLHLIELMTVGFYTGQLVQYWRLLPAWWISTKFSFNKNQKRWVLAGVFFSWSMMILRSAIPLIWFRGLMMFLNRIGCLVLLTLTITEATSRASSEDTPSSS